MSLAEAIGITANHSEVRYIRGFHETDPLPHDRIINELWNGIGDNQSVLVFRFQNGLSGIVSPETLSNTVLLWNCVCACVCAEFHAAIFGWATSQYSILFNTLGGDDGADDLTDLSALYLVLRANPHDWL